LARGPGLGYPRLTPSKSYDVAILGGGNAGFGVTAPTRQAGMKVLMVESRDLGGTCPNRGCTPKKVLVAAAHALHEIAQAPVHGIRVGKPTLDWATLIDREKDLIEGIPDRLAKTLQERGVELIRALCERLRVPNECRDLALLAARYHGEIHRAEELRPATIVKLFEHSDALRRPERFEELLLAAACDFHGRPGYESLPYAPAPLLRRTLLAARGVDAARIAREAVEPRKIAAAVHEARVHAVKAALAG